MFIKNLVFDKRLYFESAGKRWTFNVETLHSHLERDKTGCVPYVSYHIKLGWDKELNIKNEIIKTRETYGRIYNLEERRLFLFFVFLFFFFIEG